MELQLGELVDELTGRLPEASVHMLDELAEQLEEVEERLERFKVPGLFRRLGDGSGVCNRLRECADALLPWWRLHAGLCFAG